MVGRGDAGDVAWEPMAPPVCGDVRQSGQVPASDPWAPGRRDGLLAAPAGDDKRPDQGEPPQPDDERIELPDSRRVTQEPPHEQAATEVDDEDLIIGLPADAPQDDGADDEAMIGLPSQIPGGQQDAPDADDEEAMIGLPPEPATTGILPPPPAQPWERGTIDEVDLESADLDDEIIYPTED